MSFATTVAVFNLFAGGFVIELQFSDFSASAVDGTLSIDAVSVNDTSSMDSFSIDPFSGCDESEKFSSYSSSMFVSTCSSVCLHFFAFLVDVTLVSSKLLSEEFLNKILVFIRNYQII